MGFNLGFKGLMIMVTLLGATVQNLSHLDDQIPRIMHPCTKWCWSTAEVEIFV